jgi:hypothetical protein
MDGTRSLIATLIRPVKYLGLGKFTQATVSRLIGTAQP